nr:hypothetical protein [Tanacetum cinerariifolium]
MIGGSFEVSDDSQYGFHVGNLRLMHELAHNSYCKSNVWKACSTKVGISLKYREVVKMWASGDKFPLAMFAIGYLDLQASFSGVYLFGGTSLLVLEGSSCLTDDSGDSLFSYVSQSMFALERVGETVGMERSSFVVLFLGSMDCCGAVVLGVAEVFSFKEVTVHCGEYVSFAQAVAPKLIPRNISTSASQPSSPPLQFEGILGLKESILTSALKLIIDGTHNNSKQRLDCLDLDLNAADGREDKTLLLARNHL